MKKCSWWDVTDGYIRIAIGEGETESYGGRLQLAGDDADDDRPSTCVRHAGDEAHRTGTALFTPASVRLRRRHPVFPTSNRRPTADQRRPRALSAAFRHLHGQIIPLIYRPLDRRDETYAGRVATHCTADSSSHVAPTDRRLSDGVGDTAH